MMEATPRPWTFYPNIEEVWSPEGLVATVKQRGPLTELDGDFRLLETEANGELIIRAVNAHDRLIEALEDLEFSGENDRGTPGWCPVCRAYRKHIKGCRINAALALARGEGE